MIRGDPEKLCAYQQFVKKTFWSWGLGSISLASAVKFRPSNSLPKGKIERIRSCVRDLPPDCLKRQLTKHLEKQYSEWFVTDGVEIITICKKRRSKVSA